MRLNNEGGMSEKLHGHSWWVVSRINHIIDIVCQVTVFRVYISVYIYSHMWVTGYDIIGCNYVVTVVVKHFK